MKRAFYASGCLVLTLMMSSAVHGAQDYYVQSARAKVMWKPSFNAEVMDVVSRGEKFSSGEVVGSWVKVRHNLEVGYVPKLLLSTRPPFAKVGLIKADETRITYSVRRRASTYTSAAAARGLTQESRGRLSREEEVNYLALEKIEAVMVSPDEVKRFMEGADL